MKYLEGDAQSFLEVRKRVVLTRNYLLDTNMWKYFILLFIVVLSAWSPWITPSVEERYLQNFQLTEDYVQSNCVKEFCEGVYVEWSPFGRTIVCCKRSWYKGFWEFILTSYYNDLVMNDRLFGIRTCAHSIAR